ncbi:MAG: hypothetical protein ATN35_08910 [Epulopiscium sp. Nele67-Bin004]|nr:MAG: hypothetical protein ATN35_08910 [Epulopiscium sp. Nele67-Bin004]
MMRSLYSGVSGLATHQIAMDVIGNNVANVNTIGFKAQRTTFAEVFSQTVTPATGASDATGRGGQNAMQVGLGSNLSSIDTLMTTGSAQRTDNPFDLMIDGDGMLIVSDAYGTYFTRAGALRIDQWGNLVIPNGMKVQGWPANADGTDIVRGQVTDLQIGSVGNASATPEATTDVTVTGNLNVSDSAVFDEDGNLLEGDPISTNIRFYDSLGNYYSMEIQFRYLGVNGDISEWSVSIPTNDDGTTTLWDTNGNEYTADGISLTGDGVVGFTSNGTLDPTYGDGEGLLIIDGLDLNNPITGTPVNSTFGDSEGLVTVDISYITQYEATSSLDPRTGDVDGSGTGRAMGELMGYDVGTDGKINAYYSNGEMKLLGQIVVTEFANSAGMEKVGDSLFAQTANSGEFDGIGMEGIFLTGTLEMSNVDLSTEFTGMITTQRGFQANSKTITTSDEMLQELLSLKR